MAKDSLIELAKLALTSPARSNQEVQRMARVIVEIKTSQNAWSNADINNEEYIRELYT